METISSRFRFLWRHNRNLVIAAIAGDVAIAIAVVVAVLWVVL